MTGLATAPRVVLDTNVWLDLLLFDDPRAASLRQALASGDVVAIGSNECRDEWLRVLRYPALALKEAHCAALTEAHDALVQPFDAIHLVAGRPPDTTLPRCSDPDDQKFLQLAQDAGARWLVSRDRHLLSLARRCQREGLFQITTPEDWVPGSRSS
ncbi:putative toxin-antitoxin system toxin component, PIN family [Lysobacter sp. F6437]|uniref:putative toxin-antitoxin system toxin component, PIN family n=1 Tax=Lysobacter sp. F6437 TaxID=3459296 RepID=UPI00403DE276